MTQAPLRVAIDVTPLLGPRTGVGGVVGELIKKLSQDRSLSLAAVVVSWRGRVRLAEALPAKIEAKHLRWPARGCHRLWQTVDFPRITGFDLVHGTNFVVPPAGSGQELVTIHDFTAWRFPEIVGKYSQSYPSLVDRAIKRGAHVHCVSNFVADEAAEYLPIDRDRIHTVTNGFDPTPLRRIAEPLADPERARTGRPYVLAIGTEEPRKGYPTLVEAMESVWRQHHDVGLVIAGPAGWGSEALQQAIERSSQPHLIKRRGYISDDEKHRLLADAAVLAYPSLYEGFGIPLLEAMAAGVPVVSTKAGSIPEVAGDAALLVPPNEVEALGAALVQVLNDGRIRARLLAAGLERCQQFCWDVSAQQMAETYRQLAFGSPAKI